jgi:hypothetical protein
MLDCCNSSSSCPSAALSNSVHKVESVDGRDPLPKSRCKCCNKGLTNSRVFVKILVNCAWLIV